MTLPLKKTGLQKWGTKQTFLQWTPIFRQKCFKPRRTIKNFQAIDVLYSKRILSFDFLFLSTRVWQNMAHRSNQVQCLFWYVPWTKNKNGFYIFGWLKNNQKKTILWCENYINILIQISVSIKKVLLAHSRAHSPTYYLWIHFTCTATAELNSCNRDHMVWKA